MVSILALPAVIVIATALITGTPWFYIIIFFFSFPIAGVASLLVSIPFVVRANRLRKPLPPLLPPFGGAVTGLLFGGIVSALWADPVSGTLLLSLLSFGVIYGLVAGFIFGLLLRWRHSSP